MRIIIIVLLLLASGCQPSLPPQDLSMQPITIKESLTRVNILDHSGLSETITNKERLKELSQRNYLSPQPYKKVLRVYAHDKEGSSRSLITSYYENGQVRQYLECLNGRASGLYQEWHSNGQTKLLSHVLAGQADIDEKAFATWSFDGIGKAWNEQGVLTATFTYKHGVLSGLSETFYETGEKESTTFYEEGLKEGEEKTFSKAGSLLQIITYHLGQRHGPSKGYYENGKEAWTEEFSEDRLISASYFSDSGMLISSVVGGEGMRSVFESGHLSSQEEIHKGIPEGWTTLFEYDGAIERRYEVKGGKKNGTEIRYYVDRPTTTLAPRLSLEWRDGILHGTVKTWYPSGILESQREFSSNIKQGLCMAWYPDGSVMLVEEYNDDKLVRGKYHRKGESLEISSVEKGTGIATLFDSSGSVIEKIRYHEGKPQVDQ